MTSTRRLVAVLVAGMALLLLGGCMSAEARVSFDRVNALRADHGLAALVEDQELVDKASWWAQVLADEGGLRHSDLLSGVNASRWSVLGENVGTASGSSDLVALVQTVQQAFENSAPHRANALDARFTHAGVGVALAADGRVFVVQEFAAAR